MSSDVRYEGQDFYDKKYRRGSYVLPPYDEEDELTSAYDSKFLSPESYSMPTSMSQDDWQKIGQSLKSDPYPETSSEDARTGHFLHKSVRRRVSVLSPDGEIRETTITQREPRDSMEIGLTSEQQPGYVHVISSPELGLPDQIAPCIPDVYRKANGLICGECSTTQKRKEGGGEDSIVANKCKNIPEIENCVLANMNSSDSIKNKTHIALDCAKGAGLPPSIAALLINENADDTWNALDDLMDAGQASKEEPSPEVMSSDKHPKFWFGEPTYYRR